MLIGLCFCCPYYYYLFVSPSLSLPPSPSLALCFGVLGLSILTDTPDKTNKSLSFLSFCLCKSIETETNAMEDGIFIYLSYDLVYPYNIYITVVLYVFLMWSNDALYVKGPEPGKIFMEESRSHGGISSGI